MENKSWEEYISMYLEAHEDEQNCLWKQGDIACEVEVKYGENSLEKFASEVGKSTRTIWAQRQVSSTFEKCNRLQFLSWAHHYIASSTDNPLYWIEQAHDNLWSTRELAREIKKEQKQIEMEKLRDSVQGIHIEGLILGDAVEELKKLSAMSCHLVVTDPPWGVDYIPPRQGEELSFEDDKEYALDLLDKVCEELKRILVSDAHLYFFSGWKNYPEFKAIISKYFEIRNLLVWIKNNHNPCDFDRRYASQHEFIIFATQGERKLIYPCSPDVLIYDKVPNPEHGAEKPVQLLEYLIGNSSVENEVVLDPFAGSGATGVASCNLNRNFILIEKELKWYELAAKRLGGIECIPAPLIKI